jgi:hypothetical protein
MVKLILGYVTEILEICTLLGNACLAKKKRLKIMADHFLITEFFGWFVKKNFNCKTSLFRKTEQYCKCGNFWALPLHPPAYAGQALQEGDTNFMTDSSLNDELGC